MKVEITSFSSEKTAKKAGEIELADSIYMLEPRKDFAASSG